MDRGHHTRPMRPVQVLLQTYHRPTATRRRRAVAVVVRGILVAVEDLVRMEQAPPTPDTTVEGSHSLMVVVVGIMVIRITAHVRTTPAHTTTAPQVVTVVVVVVAPTLVVEEEDFTVVMRVIGVVQVKTAEVVVHIIMVVIKTTH